MAAGLIISAEMQGQVVYTDLDPDEQLSAFSDDYYYLDFNDDGITDITFFQNLWKDMYCDTSTTSNWCYGFTYQSVQVYAAGADFVNSDLLGSVAYDVLPGSPMPAGAVISVDANWSGYGFIRLFDNGGTWGEVYSDWWGDYMWVDWDYQFGQWQDIEEHKYLGVKFLIGGQTHYGWIEMTAILGTRIFQVVKIYAYAYEATPGDPIVAGFIPACYPPEPLPPVAITGTTAKVKWNTVDSVDHFELQYRPVGAAAWTTKTVAGIKTFRKLAGLTCDTEYEWRIRSFCLDGEVSLYSEIQTFNTASCRMAEDEPEAEMPVTVYTYGDQLHILLDAGEPSEWYCKVFDMFGHLVFEQQLASHATIIHTSLPSGLYIVAMEYSGQVFSTSVGLYK